MLQIFIFQNTNEVEFRYVISKNLELFTELLLVFFLFFIDKRSSIIKYNLTFFLETYFNLNIIYLILFKIYSPVFFFFHPSYTFISNREMLLGYEPSYTVTLTFVFFLAYAFISKNKKNIFLYSILTSYCVFLGESKTMWIIFILLGLYYIINKFIYLKTKIKYILPAVILSIMIFNSYIINELEVLFGVNEIHKLSKIEQYESISKITRLESIKKSFELFFAQPFGYGYGYSIIEFSNYLQSSNIQSFEIMESKWTANTPKSQFIEFLISGGIIFMFLFFRKLKFLLREIAVNDKYLYMLIPVIFTFIFIERLPYILFFSILYVIPKINVKINKYEK